jgi:hypothetical protein
VEKRARFNASVEASPSAALGFRVLQLLAAALVAAPVIYWRGGVLDSEATWFISHYLDHRGVVQKVFDPNINDFKSYQGRELSYFFDYLDAQVFRVLLDMGFPLFVAASSLMATLALVLIHGLVTGRVLPHLNRTTSILVLLLFLSGFVHLSTDGTMYRSAKPLLVPLVLLSMTLIWHWHQMPRDEPWSPGRRAGVFLACFALGSAMSLLDRMGFFLMTVAAAIVAVHCLLRRGRRAVFLGLAAASFFGELYNRVLGPLLIHAVNGYWPDFKYQRLDVTRVFTEPVHLVEGGYMLLEQGWLFFGSFALWIAIAAVAVFLANYLRRSRSIGELARAAACLPLLYALLTSVALVLLLSLMLVRHPQMYDVDHRLWYYAVPIQAVLIFPTMLGLDWFLAGASSRRVLVVNALLLCLVVGNIAAWSGYRRQMLAAEWYPISYQQSAALRQSLALGRPDPQLREPYLTFFQVCTLFSNASRMSVRASALVEQGS